MKKQWNENQNISSVLHQMKEKLQGKKVLLACSTGVDSMVLLHLLGLIKAKEDIVVVHINHQKRLASIEEEAFIQDYTKKLGMMCYTHKLPHYEGSNFQEWARTLRYQYFYTIAKQEHIDMILLAHHADDNLETILMRMIRSASLEGYAGIRPLSYYQDCVLYRPLLGITKDEIYMYAKLNHITYFEDASNDTDDYMRNRIRHHIIPILKQENPNLTKAIVNYSTTLFHASDYFEKLEINFIKTLNLVHTNNDYFVKIHIADFKQLDSFLQEQVLFRLLKPFDLSKEAIHNIQKQMTFHKSKIVYHINLQLNFIKEYGYVIFTTRSIDQVEFYCMIEKEGTYILPENRKIEVGKNICTFITLNQQLWYNIPSYPFVIRTRENGDKIKLKSGTKSISDYLTDLKVPYLERKNILLLCNQNNCVVAVLGYTKK